MAAALAQTVLKHNFDSEGEKKICTEAVEALSSKPRVKAGLLRNWRLRAIDPEQDDDDQTEIWVIKYAPNEAGTVLAKAMEALDSHSILAAAGIEMRADRVPKGTLHKALEQGLEKYFGKKGAKKGGKGEKNIDDDEA